VKTIQSEELQANLNEVLNSARNERIVIYRQGKPCAILAGIQDYDNEDLELATSQDFWLMIQQRRSEGNSIPLANVEAQLKKRRRKTARPGSPARKPQTRKQF